MAAKIESIDVDVTLRTARLLMEDEQGIPSSASRLQSIHTVCEASEKALVVNQEVSQSMWHHAEAF